MHETRFGSRIFAAPAGQPPTLRVALLPVLPKPPRDAAVARVMGA